MYQVWRDSSGTLIPSRSASRCSSTLSVLVKRTGMDSVSCRFSDRGLRPGLGLATLRRVAFASAVVSGTAPLLASGNAIDEAIAAAIRVTLTPADLSGTPSPALRPLAERTCMQSNMSAVETREHAKGVVG